MPKRQRNRYRRFNFGASRFNNKDAGEQRLLFQGQDTAGGSALSMHAVALVGDSATHGNGGSGACLSGQTPVTAQSSVNDTQLSGSQETAKMSVLLEEDLVNKWCSAKQQRGFVEDKDFISYLLFIVSEYETMTGTYVLQPVPTPKSPTKPLTRQASKKRYLPVHSEPDDAGRQRVKRGKRKQSKVVRPASPPPADVLPRQNPDRHQLAQICEDNPVDLPQQYLNKEQVAEIQLDLPRQNFKDKLAEIQLDLPRQNPNNKLAETQRDFQRQNPKDKLTKTERDLPRQNPMEQLAKIQLNLSIQNPKDQRTEIQLDLPRQDPNNKLAGIPLDVPRQNPKDEHAETQGDLPRQNPTAQLAKIKLDLPRQNPKNKLAVIPLDVSRQNLKKEQLVEICDDNPLDLSISSHQGDQGDGMNTAEDTMSELQKVLAGTELSSGLSVKVHNITPEEAILDFSTKKSSPDANANIADRPITGQRRKREFPCHVCGKVFDRVSHLKRHKRTHGEDEQIPCDICGEVVSGKAWCRHRKAHEETKIFQCPWEGCSLAFKDRKLWQDHVSFVHKGQTSVQCTWIGCDKTFPRHAQMERHLHTHTPRRTFSCHVCHKVFRHKPNLSVHMRVHSGEAPFKCPHCEYRGRQQSALKWHMKKHHNTIVTSFISFKMEDSPSGLEPKDLANTITAEQMWQEPSPAHSVVPLMSYM